MIDENISQVFCEFCSLSEKDKKFYLCENDFWDVYLADKQNYIGRCMIVCKRHCESIEALRDEEWLSLKVLTAGLEDTIRNAFGADMFNLACLMNDEYKKEKPNPHLHFHLIPRYAKPVRIGDNVFVDNEWAHHYNSKAPVQLSIRDMEAVFYRVKSNLTL